VQERRTRRIPRRRAEAASARSSEQRFASSPLDVPPQRFGGIQLRSVPRQPFDPQPMTLRVQVIADQGTLVRWQLVPDQDDAPPAQVAGQGLEKLQHPVPGAAAGRGAEPHLMTSAIPAKAERQADQQLLPVEAVDQDGGLAPRRPGPGSTAAARCHSRRRRESRPSSVGLFLQRTTAVPPSAGRPPRRARGLGGPAAGESTAADGGSARHGRDDSARR
jgi:hypothetical protein